MERSMMTHDRLVRRRLLPYRVIPILLVVQNGRILPMTVIVVVAMMDNRLEVATAAP